MSEELKWTGERLVSTKENEIVIHHLHRYALAIELCKDKNILDIASGEGYGTNLISTVAKNVIGVDIDEEAIEFSKKKYLSKNLQFLLGSASEIPLENNSIDIVVSFETLEHHDKHLEMFAEIKRVLRPDGILIMSSPDKLNYRDIPNFQNPFHVKELYREEFKTLVNNHFNFVKIFYQNILYASVIVSETGNSTGFSEYDGTFTGIKKTETLSVPMYNICVASAQDIQHINFPENTIFNAPQLLERMLNKETEIYNSRTYKIGKMVTFPYRLIKKIFNK
jgi:ubiquinone/menaquinone biosynthesis C-methylase UbiE